MRAPTRAFSSFLTLVVFLGIGLTLSGCASFRGGDGSSVFAGEWDPSGEIQLELRGFPDDPAYSDQDDAPVSGSVMVEPEVVVEWGGGDHRITARAFGRVDTLDDGRTHWDLRELNYLYQADTWALRAGSNVVFWGVTESRHLVDVINQSDALEDIDDEDKLGQPMVQATLEGDWGALDLYYLPVFRERAFLEERLRGPLPVSSRPLYESGAEEWHQDWALRWSQSFDSMDIGLSHFQGTSREPTFVPEARSSGTVLRPYYALMNQTGLDVQWTEDAWLLKLEAIRRSGDHDAFVAAVGGCEYTFFQFVDGLGDLGILAEVLFDDRPRSAPPTIFEHDGFVGARWSLEDAQDTSVLAGAVIDFQSGETLFSVEASRRVGESLVAELQSRLFWNTDDESPAHGYRRDTVTTLSLTWSL